MSLVKIFFFVLGLGFSLGCGAQISILFDSGIQVQSSTSTLGYNLINPAFFRNRYNFLPTYGIKTAYKLINKKLEIGLGFNKTRFQVIHSLEADYGSGVTFDEKDFEVLPDIKFDYTFNEWSVGYAFSFYTKKRSSFVLTNGMVLLQFVRPKEDPDEFGNLGPFYFPVENKNVFLNYQISNTGLNIRTLQIYLGTEYRRFVYKNLYFQVSAKIFYPISGIISTFYSADITSEDGDLLYQADRVQILKGDRIIFGLGIGYDF